MSDERQTETHQAERVRDGMGHVWTEESDLDRLDELEAEVARVRAKRDEAGADLVDPAAKPQVLIPSFEDVKAGRTPLPLYGEVYVQQLRDARDAAEARVAELEAERDRAVAERTADRDRWHRGFNRIEAAISHHKRDCEANDVPDTHDEALWAARDRVLHDLSAPTRTQEASDGD